MTGASHSQFYGVNQNNSSAPGVLRSASIPVFHSNNFSIGDMGSFRSRRASHITRQPSINSLSSYATSISPVTPYGSNEMYNSNPNYMGRVRKNLLKPYQNQSMTHIQSSAVSSMAEQDRESQTQSAFVKRAIGSGSRNADASSNGMTRSSSRLSGMSSGGWGFSRMYVSNLYFY